jgi:hypothetical protein
MVHSLVCSGYTTVFMLKILDDTRNVEFCTLAYPSSPVYFIPLVCSGYTTVFMLKILDTRNVEFCTRAYPSSPVYFIPLWYRYLIFRLL